MNYEELFRKEKEKRLAIKALLEGESPDLEQIKTLKTEADALHARATEMKKNEEALKALQAPQMPAPLPTDSEPAPQAPESAQEAAMKAAYVMRFGEPDAAVKAVLRDLHGNDYEQRRYEQWKGFGHYLRTGEGENREFLWTPETIVLALREGQDVKAMKTVMVEASDTLGGYAVPEDYRADVISRMAGYTVVRPLANVMQTSRDSVEIPTMTGGDSQFRDAVRVTWVDETPTAGTAATNLTMGHEKLMVYTVMAETFLSRNLVEDAAFNILSWLAESFASAQAIDEDNKFLKNTGAGSPEGIILNDTTRSSTTIAEVPSENSSALTADGIIALVYGIDKQYRQNARLVGAKATMREIRQLKTGSGEYIWDRDYQAGQPDRVLGYPVLEQENMPTITANYYPLIFGDFKGYTIVDRVGMSIERYLGGEEARINQVLYIARRRLGGQCTNPWCFAVQDVST